MWPSWRSPSRPASSTRLPSSSKLARSWLATPTRTLTLTLTLYPNPNSVKEDAAGHAPAQTDWGLIAVLALGALGSNTAMASLLTCQALYLQHLFGFGSLQFGFVMMGTATFSILVRLLVP